MTAFAESFIDEIIKVAAASSVSKIQMPPSPKEMENKMLQEEIDNVNLKVQAEQAQQAAAAMEQQKAMQQQQQQAEAMKAQQQQQQQQQAAEQGGGAPLPGNPQGAVIEEGS